MAGPLPGDYITTKCSRCNDITGHVVTIVLEGTILKVECKACGSIHKYRDAVKVAKPKQTVSSVRHVRAGQNRDQAVELGTPRSRAIGVQEKKVVRTQKLTASKLETAWQEAMVRHAIDTPIPYSMNASFELNTLIEHPKFGRGEVISVVRPDKIEVLFQDGVKTLRCTLS